MTEKRLTAKRLKPFDLAYELVVFVDFAHVQLFFQKKQILGIYGYFSNKKINTSLVEFEHSSLDQFYLEKRVVASDDVTTIKISFRADVARNLINFEERSTIELTLA